MLLTKQIADHFRHLYFGGNWTSVNYKDTLSGIDRQQAITKIGSLNTIATLVYHTNYYIIAVTKVLKGGSLDAHDKFSFDLPPIQSDEDWNKLLDNTWRDAENFANLIERLAEETLWEVFSDGKYGNFYRNLLGIIEHSHYHLGQIVAIKKLVLEKKIADSPDSL